MGGGGGGGAVEAVSVFEAQALSPIAAASVNTTGMVAFLTTIASLCLRAKVDNAMT